MEDYSAGELWPADGEEGALTREVYARFGLAMYHVQVLEHGMVNAVVVLTILQQIRSYSNRETWEQAFDATFSRELAKTYGNMIRSIEKLPDIPRDLVDRLRAAKEPRDILAHRFFRLHDEDLLSTAGMKRMLAWCEEQIALFKSLDQELSSVIKPAMERQGVTEDWISERFSEDLARLGIEL